MKAFIHVLCPCVLAAIAGAQFVAAQAPQPPKPGPEQNGSAYSSASGPRTARSSRVRWGRVER